MKCLFIERRNSDQTQDDSGCSGLWFDSVLLSCSVVALPSRDYRPCLRVSYQLLIALVAEISMIYEMKLAEEDRMKCPLQNVYIWLDQFHENQGASQFVEWQFYRFVSRYKHSLDYILNRAWGSLRKIMSR